MWCGFKTAFICDNNKVDDVIAGYDVSLSNSQQVTVWDYFTKDKLPKDWSLKATGIGGASGFYLEFEIEELPLQKDMDTVEALINNFDLVYKNDRQMQA